MGVGLARKDSDLDHYGLRSSVRYFGASATTFAINAASATLSSLGAGDVRAATGSPTSMKNSSCPAGVHMQSIRTVLPELFLNTCGAFAVFRRGIRTPFSG